VNMWIFVIQICCYSKCGVVIKEFNLHLPSLKKNRTKKNKIYHFLPFFLLIHKLIQNLNMNRPFKWSLANIYYNSPKFQKSIYFNYPFMELLIMLATYFIDYWFCTSLVQHVVNWVKTTSYAQKTKVTCTPTHQGLLENIKNAHVVIF
jgi:hypothetical protein